MAISKTPPSGFRDFPPQEAAARWDLIETIVRTYRSFGFEPISTSAVEDLAVLMGKGGGENEKLIFKILKRGDKLMEFYKQLLERSPVAGQFLGDGADLGLRFDLTLPLARFYSQHGSTLPKPFKVFQIGPVWRAERAQKGRYREFYQCDVDVLGSESSLCEIDVILAILAVFRDLSLNDVTVHLNDRSLVYAALAHAGVPAEKTAAVCTVLDKLDKLPRDKVAGEVAELTGERVAEAIQKKFMQESGDHGFYHEIGPERYGRLREILAAVSSTAKTDKILINPSLMRGFDYYTGPVFEFRVEGLSGSLGGGGRYDELIERLGGPKTPACGGSIGFERLMLILAERAQKEAAGPATCVTVFSEELRAKSLELAASLRAAGISADVYPGADKLGRQFKYADSKRAAYALVIGPEEAEKGLVKAKNLKTGEEFSESADALVRRLKQ